MRSFIQEIHIDKLAKHHRCPECDDILFSMTGGYILAMSASLLCEIESHRLPANFSPEGLPLQMCRECKKEAALLEAESLLEGVL